MSEKKNLSVREWIRKERREQGGEGKKPPFWRHNYDYGEGFYDQINRANDCGYTEATIVKEEKPSVKLAVIRGDGLRDCPFGLDIPNACESVGAAINRMAPLINAEDSEKLTKANKLVYLYHKENKKCPFAAKILDNYNKVDCDYGDTAQGYGDPSWQGSPLYIQTFNGLDASGLNSQPLGFYAQNDPSRNMFFGLFSLLGNNTTNDIVKLAEDYEKCGDIEKSKILDRLIERIYELKVLENEDLEKLENYLQEYKDCVNMGKIDSGTLNELFQRWWGPRQNYNL